MIFVFKCPRGHTVKKSEDDAETFNGTACNVCYGPMILRGVKTQ